MSPTEEFGEIPEPTRREAADWFARMRSPEAAASRQAFEDWYNDPGNARAYEQIVGRWEQSAFIGATPTGRSRYLPRASLAARHPAWAMAAALIAVAGATGLIVARFRPHSAPTEIAEVASSQRFASGGTLREVALGDGSHVTLDRASLLLVSYSDSRRAMRLEQGRARFDVAHDAARPFVVSAGAGEVTAHGTLFDVALRGEVATVTLLRGTITVAGRSAASPPRWLRAGQQIVVTRTGSALETTAVAPRTAAWLPPMIEVDRMPLEQAASEIGAGAKQRIRFVGTVGALRITGAFRAGDLEALARAAAAMFDLRLEHDASGDYILSVDPSRGVSTH
ncbi:FecR family protein [Sphingomonas crusticola]|uniref:FecR family protein n=1 Tax=Sphingomonas crusticola TaxID=1697973 RepID=UPI000E252720|nr:FecR domain-containing protein [Sphingomonas crusticola]